MLAGRKYTPEDIFRILVRRRWLVLVPFALGLATIPFVAPRVPERYRSETLIMVVPQRVPDTYVKSTVTETIEDRLPSISDQILSRTRLERIITDLDLYKEQRSQDVMEDVVRGMRADINVTLAAKSLDSFRVSYVSANPETARKVTERLASLYIDQNLKDRETQAESTSQFLEAQLADAKQRLVEHEKKLETYRKQHAGQLPSQLQGNLQAIANAQLQLQAVSESTNRARERRLLIERQIADAEAFAMTAPAAPVPVTGDAPQPTTTAQQLDAAQARLEAMKLRYTPDHPDMIALKRTIAELQERVAAEGPVSGSGPSLAEKALTPAELAQQKKIADLKAEVEVIDHQLAAAQAEEQRLKGIISQYQAKVDVLPTRESELVELTRDYSTLQTAYANLLMKREDSKIAANLERQQIGEQFRILDPASLPEKPYNQLQRLGIISSGAGAGLILGLLIVGVLEYRDSSFRREDEVLRVLKLPVLALVPLMASDRQRLSERRRGRLADVAGIAVLIGATAILALWRLRS